MSVKESSAIRAALKAAGYGTQDVSVRNESYSMGSTVQVTIKRAEVPKANIEAIATQFEKVDRDGSGEILSGGNTFVSVDYEHGALDAHADLAREQLYAGRSVFGSFSLSNDASYPHLQSFWKTAPDGRGSHAGSVQREHAAEGLVRILAAAGELACLDLACAAFTNADGILVSQAPRVAAAPLERNPMIETVSVPVAIDISWKQIEDTLCAAWEGGSNYWLECYGAKAPTDPADAAKVEQRYQNALYPGGKCLVRLVEERTELPPLTRERLIEGLKIFAKVSPMHFANVICEDGDATTGDVFLQCCLLGEVVYG